MEGGESNRNLILATVAFAACFSAWGMLAPLGPKLEDQLGLSNTETAVMVAVPVVLGSLLRIPLGLLTDRIGGRPVFAVMLFYSAAAAVLVGFASSYVALLGAGFLLGAAGASFAVGVPFVAEWFPKQRQGFAIGVYGMGNIGTAVAAFSIPALRDATSQAFAGVVFGVVIAAYGLVWWVLAREAPGERQRTNYGEVLRAGWRLWRLALFYFVTFGGFVAMAIFLPKLLKDWFDYSLTDAGLRAGGFTIAATLARPIGGWLSDRVGASRVLIAAFVGVALDAGGLAWQASDPTIVPVTIFCLTMAAFLGLGSGAVFKMVPTEFPEATGAATGIVGAAGGLGGFFPPLVMGIVKDLTGEFVLGFVFLVCFACLCALLTVRMIRSTGAAIEQGEPSPGPVGPT